MQQRKYSRIQYKNYIEVHYHGGVWGTRSIDLSLRGMRLQKPQGLEIDNETSITLSFQDGDSNTEVDGKLIFTDVKEWRVVFTHIGEKSLKNLISSVKRGSQKSDMIMKEAGQMVLKVAD